tara:strand:- start:971 stop:1120 length:150 start_codon:yes stop_codon:yes gene_type:complete
MAGRIRPHTARARLRGVGGRKPGQSQQSDRYQHVILLSGCVAGLRVRPR